MTGYVSGRLRGYVHVVADDGMTHVFGPSTEVPQWAAEKITNSRAWATQPTIPAAPATVTDPGVGGSGQDADAGTGEVPVRPPNSGKGAGRPEWAAFATRLGIEFTDADNRDAIRAKVEAWEATPAEDDGEE